MHNFPIFELTLHDSFTTSNTRMAASPPATANDKRFGHQSSVNTPLGKPAIIPTNASSFPWSKTFASLEPLPPAAMNRPNALPKFGCQINFIVYYLIKYENSVSHS